MSTDTENGLIWDFGSFHRKEMTKRDFIVQYVLNRSLTNTRGLDGQSVTCEAERAWDEIERISAKDARDDAHNVD